LEYGATLTLENMCFWQNICLYERFLKSSKTPDRLQDASQFLEISVYHLCRSQSSTIPTDIVLVSFIKICDHETDESVYFCCFME
jgi:hypothetical protein